jgi:WD40 repeat protein
MNYILNILMGFILFCGISASIGVMEFGNNPNIKITCLPGDTPVRSVTFDSCDRLKSLYSDGTVKLWNIKTGECEAAFVNQGNWATAVAFSPDGIFIASGHANGTIELCNVRTKKIENTFWGHNDFVSAVAFSSDGKFIVSGSWDKTVKLWDLEKKAFKYTFVGHNYPVQAVAFSPNGRLIASGAKDGTVRLWNVKTKECVCWTTHTKFEEHLPATSIAFNKDGAWIGVGLENGTIVVYKDTFAQEQIFALAQAMHLRLGDESSAQSLTPDVLKHIYENLGVMPWETVFGR